MVSVIVLPYRSPILVAKMLSTIDRLSGGRAIAGVAAGCREEEFAALSVSFADRNDMTGEAVRVMNDQWTSDRPAFEGRFTQFAGVLGQLPCPVQRPHSPIWVGGTAGGDPARGRAGRRLDPGGGGGPSPRPHRTAAGPQHRQGRVPRPYRTSARPRRGCRGHHVRGRLGRVARRSDGVVQGRGHPGPLRLGRHQGGPASGSPPATSPRAATQAATWARERRPSLARM